MSDEDQELRALLGDDEELLAAAAQVRAVLHEPEIDPDFQRRLGVRVVSERARVIAERRPLRPWWPRPAVRLAVGLAAAALVVALAVPFVLLRTGAPVVVAASSPVLGLASVNPASAIVVRFSRPMDHVAVASALHISPATTVRTAWRGDELVVTPLHRLAPNAPYVLTIDAARARTAAGAALTADLHVVFGTAPVAQPGGAPPAPVDLPVRTVAAAAAGSEAVVTGDGALIATSASSFGFSGLLRLMPDGTVERLAPEASTICVSRSGGSLAYLRGSGADASIVMTGPDGTGGQAVRTAVDQGSPLGWINDDEVSFVGDGRLRAVDRAGHVRILRGDAIDAAKDTVVIAPGGRYVYLRPGSATAPGAGQLIDLGTGRSHPLPGIAGQPAFSADGGTVSWVDGSGAAPRLARAPAAGGPVLTLPLPLAPGDQVGDLAVGPDASRFVYSVTHAAGGGELRLAAADDAATLAASRAGTGESPNWAAAGDRVAVLGRAGSQPELQVADVPGQTADAGDAATAVATAFANAQVDGDRDALRALAGPAVHVEALPGASRASVVQVRSGPGGGAHVDLRLVIDPTPGRPVARAIAEGLDLGVSGGRLTVDGVTVSGPTDVPPGPHVVRVAAGPAPGSVVVTFDGELDPATVAGAFGRGAAYDAASRSVTVTPPNGAALTIRTSLRDVAGRHLAAPAPVRA